MKKNNFNNVSLAQNFSIQIKKVGKQIKNFWKVFIKISQKHRLTFQRIQLTCIHFFGIVVLIYSIQNSLGEFPPQITSFFPFANQVLGNSLLKIFATPEKIFFCYLLILEFFINRSTFNLSLLVKYNILLIFILEMVQNLLLIYWDLVVVREFEISFGDVLFSEIITFVFYFGHFFLFFSLYLYSYWKSFHEKFPIFPGNLRKITDSIAFWLHLKQSEKPEEQI